MALNKKAVPVRYRREVMQAMRNKIFSIICILFLAGPILYIAFCELYPQIRDLPANAGAEYLTGEKAIRRFEPPISMQSFTAKKTQQYMEDYIGGNIPAKSVAILNAAALQRDAISLSNIAFGYDCYPSFYDSEILYIPSHDALMHMPMTQNENLKSDLVAFCDGLEGWMQNHSDMNVRICLADISEYSALNPASSYMQTDFCTNDAYGYLMSRFGSSEQIRLAYLQNDSLDDYFANYYTTDHHWNGYGASETYNALAFDSREGFKASSVINTSGLEINGSLARSGLDLLDEPVSEPLLDTSGMLADYVDGSIPLLQQGEIGLKDESLPVEFNFYHEWYGPSANCVIMNSGKDLSGPVVVVGDSYSSAFQWLVAQNHSSTATYLDMHGAYEGEETLNDRLQETGADTVYFVGCLSAFGYLRQCYPNYFHD